MSTREQQRLADAHLEIDAFAEKHLGLHPASFPLNGHRPFRHPCLHLNGLRPCLRPFLTFHYLNGRHLCPTDLRHRLAFPSH